MRFFMGIMLAVVVSAAPSAQSAKPRVYVLSTGGTIAGQGSSTTDLSNYKPGSILGEQLVKAVPQIADIADVRTYSRLPLYVGSGLTDENLARYYPLADGFIVGTYFKQDGVVNVPRVRELMQLL